MFTYKDAGVDIDKGDQLVERIKQKVKSTYGENVVSGVGGFACLYKMDENRFLSAGTDGVGTKLLLAQRFNKHDTIGIDLVAMCVNDIICTGARPLFFMDYLACGELDLSTSEHIIDGIVNGCKQSHMALIGGETAEMPGMYKKGEYDLAGFAIGEVFQEQLLDGSRVKAGDTLIGIPASGAHSNGFSLLRKIFEHDEVMLESLLTPTRIYVNELLPLINDQLITGLSHITGGGVFNIPRMNGHFDYEIIDWNSNVELFERIKSFSKLAQDELFKTFNMGIGMVIATRNPEQVLSLIDDSLVVGKVVDGSGKVRLKNFK